MQTNSFDINKYPKKLGSDVAIFQHGNFVDVFHGDDWTSHTRLQKKRTKNGTFLTKITGVNLPSSIYTQVNKEVQ